MFILKLEDFRVFADKKEIVKGVNLEIKKDEIHLIMGPNGSGKSTLAYGLMGNPKYKTKGRILLEGKDISNEPPEKRAKAGLYMAFQNPPEIEGVSYTSILKKSYSDEIAKRVGLKKEVLKRGINYGFSGGEKKRSELLQMIALRPKIAIMDEIDSGIDADGIKLISEIIKERKKETSFLIITHYERLLKYIEPDYVHIFFEGRIVKSGKKDLAEEIIEKGYACEGCPVKELCEEKK